MKTKIFFLVLAIVASITYSSYAQDDTETINIFRTSFDNEKDLYDGFPSPEQAEGKVNVKVENGYYKIKGINTDRNHLIMEFPQYNQSDLVSFKIEADIIWESGDEFQPFGICVVDANDVAYRFALNHKGYSKVHTSNENEPGDVEMIHNRIFGSYSNYFKIEINSNGLYGYLNDNYWAAIVGSIAHPIKYAGYFTKGFTVVSSGSFTIDKTVKLPPKASSHTSPIDVVALNEDNSQLISVGSNPGISGPGYALWNTESGAELKRDQIATTCCSDHNFSFSPDLKYCMYETNMGDKGEMITVKPVDAPNPTFQKTFRPLKKDPRGYDGFKVSGFLDNKYFVYHELKANIIHYIDLATGTPFKSVKIKDKTLELVTAIDLSKVFFENETTVMCYDLDAQQVLYEIPYSWGSFSLTNDKKYLFFVGPHQLQGYIKWFNVSDGTLVKEFKQADHPLPQYSRYIISDDNNYIICSSMEDLFFIVDLENCEVTKSYPYKGVISYTVSKDMQYIFIGYQKGQLHQIDAATGETVKLFGNIKEN